MMRGLPKQGLNTHTVTRLYATKIYDPDASADESLFLGILTLLTKHSKGDSGNDALKICMLATMAQAATFPLNTIGVLMCCETHRWATGSRCQVTA